MAVSAAVSALAVVFGWLSGGKAPFPTVVLLWTVLVAAIPLLAFVVLPESAYSKNASLVMKVYGVGWQAP